ncbi:histidinol dehydrogenase [Methanogenium sp. S4BF]|uniref:histidinol dehydrogenase n=1 Tax=Methanogenium sp. S4BF TaxID=1789226 RepID=UPI003242015E
MADSFAILSKIENAGSIFAGPFTTAGYARMYSGIIVDPFCKTSTIQMIDREGLEAIGDIVETLADAEGLHAHAESVRVWRK